MGETGTETDGTGRRVGTVAGDVPIPRRHVWGVDKEVDFQRLLKLYGFSKEAVAVLCNEGFHTLDDLRQVSQKALSKLGEELKKSFRKVSFLAVSRFKLGVAHYYVQYCDRHNHVVVAKHCTDG